ncbi:MAG: GspE/PulE family protein [Patescibacteria group bacterium]|nr:GspE/PulE family protein [Patescibacteria group bacterium]
MPDRAFNAETLNRRQRPEVTTAAVAEQFSNKMSEISIREREREARATAAAEGIPYINLFGFAINPEALQLVSEDEARATGALPFYYHEGDIRLAAVDPTRPEVAELKKRLEQEHRARVMVYFISAHSLETALKLYAALPKFRNVVSGVVITEEELLRHQREIKTFRELEEKIRSATLTDLVALMISTAITSRASDIHIEAEERALKVRFRIDGILHDVATIDKKDWVRIIARVKLLSHLKINVIDKPQDGRFTIFLTNEKIDVRVSCLPTTYGESVVMRLLLSSAVALTFESLGLRGKAYEDLLREIEKPNGMVMTTGPTGSGKTTTLYAILTKLNTPDSKVITIEDPVEYRLSGITQSQVDHSRGYTFATGLRSILRQDPDIVMVGEIRDLETADIAINAALTGHLVFSTLHTNDASGTVPRFLAMNVKPFLLAPALNAMIGQRLVRKLCDKCKRPEKADPKLMERVVSVLDKIPEESGVRVDTRKLTFFSAPGCEACQKLGYYGRIAVFEIMTMNKEVEELILSGHVSEYDMLRVAVKHGMITMLQDGLLKAADGITSLDEVFRVAKDTTASYE